MKSVDEDVDRLYRLSINMQKLFREWHALEQRPDSNPVLGGAALGTQLDSFLVIVREYDDEQLRAEMRKRVKVGEGWAVGLFDQAAASALGQRPDPERRINPYAVGLRPERWDEDGLYDEPGLTVEEATKLATGAEVPSELPAELVASEGGPEPQAGDGMGDNREKS
jgi:hypothetical protein